MDTILAMRLSQNEQILKARYEAMVTVYYFDKSDNKHKLKQISEIDEMIKLAVSKKQNADVDKGYWGSYVSMLHEIKSMVVTESQDVVNQCFRLRYFVDGQYDAIQFVIECSADIDAINLKIEQKEQSIKSGRSAMKPTASPGIHARGMLYELKRLREIVLESQGK